MPFHIIRQDITKMQVDAIVNAANTALKPGGGVCGAIFSAAGAEKLKKECEKIGHCPTGHAVITKGYALPARYIIHTAGPVWQGGGNSESALLYACYRNCLDIARKKRLKSIAFPLISGGIYGYPKDQAIEIAHRAISDFLLMEEMEIYLTVFSSDAFHFSTKRFADVAAYIDDHYVDAHLYSRQSERMRTNEFAQAAPMPAFREKAKRPGWPEPGDLPAPAPAPCLQDAVKNLDESFSQALFRIIDEKGLKDPQVYKKANLSRKLFSKIRVDSQYRPKKTTALALAIALELNLEETNLFLSRAGYILSHSHIGDIIVEYFIQQKHYNIFDINAALFDFDQALLGG